MSLSGYPGFSIKDFALTIKYAINRFFNILFKAMTFGALAYDALH